MPEMRGEIEIPTPRLRLRPLRRHDADAIVAGVGDLAVSRWLSTVPHPYALEDAHAFIAAKQGARDHWVITCKDELLGLMTIGSELGYWLRRAAWEQGFATEAGFAVLDHWFSRPGNDCLFASYFLDNEPSGNVLRKLGFEDDGESDQFSESRGTTVRRRDMRLTRARWEAMQCLPFIVTPRLRSRPLLPEDAGRLVEIAGIPEVARNTTSIPAPWDLSEARDWIGAGSWRDQPGFRLALCNRNGETIGMAGLLPMNEYGEASLAYLIEKSHWGRGLASEFVAALIPAAFRAFPLTAIVANHFVDNPASGAVLRKCGFVRTGERMGESRARLEPAPVSIYRLERSSFEARS